MQAAALADEVHVELREPGFFRAETNRSYIPTDERNIAVKAAKAYFEAAGIDSGAYIKITKRIPVCAGMGGGSSDAAAVLRALNSLEGEPYTPAQLARVGEEVGSDVPYCVMGGTALAEGRGEVLTALPALPKCWVAVCKPDFSISTPELFARIDSCKIRRRPDTEGLLAALGEGDLAGVARRMYNVFEDVLPPRQQARVAGIKHTLIQRGALGANMSGTGPTAFGLFQEEEAAREAVQALAEHSKETFLAQTV